MPKTFEEVQNEVDKKVEQLYELDEKFRRWEFNLDNVHENKFKYKWRVRNWKKRIRELKYKDVKPDDYHDRDKHLNDKF